MGHPGAGYHGRVSPLPTARKALLFSAGGVRLALAAGAAPRDCRAGARRGRGGDPRASRCRPPASPPCSGCRPARRATRWSPRTRRRRPCGWRRCTASSTWRDAEAFQLPAHTVVPPAVALRRGAGGEAGGGPRAGRPVPGVRSPGAGARTRASRRRRSGPSAERELRFARGRLTFGVPVSMLVQVVRARRGWRRCRSRPPSHRGLLYHGRALHAVIDVAVYYGWPPSPSAAPGAAPRRRRRGRRGGGRPGARGGAGGATTTRCCGRPGTRCSAAGSLHVRPVKPRES